MLLKVLIIGCNGPAKLVLMKTNCGTPSALQAVLNKAGLINYANQKVQNK